MIFVSFFITGDTAFDGPDGLNVIGIVLEDRLGKFFEDGASVLGLKR